MSDVYYVLNTTIEIVRVGSDKFNFVTPEGSFAVRDASGLTLEIITAAQNSINIDEFIYNLSDRFLVPAIEATIKALVDKKILLPSDRVQALDPAIIMQSYQARQTHLDKMIRYDMPDPGLWQIFVAGDGVLAHSLKSAVADLGMQVHPYDEEKPDEIGRTSLIVAASDGENFEPLRVINRQTIALAVPTLYIWLDRHVVRCGPLTHPHATACFECYYHRLRSTRRFITEFDARADGVIASPQPSRVSLHWAVAVATSQIVGFIAGTQRDAHLSPIREINTLRSEIRTSHLLRLPRCPVCGLASTEVRPPEEVFQHAVVRRV